MSKVKHCTSAMDAWGKKLRARYKEDISLCRKNIEVLRALPRGSEGPAMVESKNRLCTSLAREEAFWKQRAKVY